MGVSGSLILVEFSGVPRLMESNKFLRHRVDISRNLRLIDFSKFLKFWFRVRAVYYKTFLLATRGSKQKLEVILINNHFI
jgi:hypothetical protein